MKYLKLTILCFLLSGASYAIELDFDYHIQLDWLKKQTKKLGVSLEKDIIEPTEKVARKIVKELPAPLQKKQPPYKFLKYLPNAISIKPIRLKTYELESESNTADESGYHLSGFHENEDIGDFFSNLTISGVQKPLIPWSWGFSLSPSLTFINFPSPQELKTTHINLGLAFRWHFYEPYGSISIKAGAGPMILRGRLYGVEEKRKFSFAPFTELSYYKFISERFFVQLKYKNIFLLEGAFKNEETGQDLTNLSSLGLHVGFIAF